MAAHTASKAKRLKAKRDLLEQAAREFAAYSRKARALGEPVVPVGAAPPLRALAYASVAFAIADSDAHHSGPARTVVDDDGGAA
jgi:hypothetical protein